MTNMAIGQNTNKGATLLGLKDKLKLFTIPDMLLKNASEFTEDPKLFCNEILSFFRGKQVVVRSSASDEDGSGTSSAGKYHSELNVPSDNEAALYNALHKVVASFAKSDSSKKSHQIIIQEMIMRPIMSGVLFSHELASGAPYYVINYDDVSGTTDSVTSGVGEYSNRTLYIRRKGLESIRSERFKSLISAVRELEDALKTNHIDIEFAMNDKLEPILFQARPLTGTTKWDFEQLEKSDSLIVSTKSDLENALKSVPEIFGKSNIFGQMPDWNPAEMIGRVPRALAYSLYEELITNGPWLTGRSSMGYHLPPANKLMFSFAGQPYIDVRLSFNSFLPANLSSTTSNKLINHWLSKLIEKPHYHDKVEFEIVTTCYDFDFDTKAVKLLDEVLDQQELKEFKDKLKDLTFPLLRGEGESSIQKCLDKIRQLEAKQNENGFIHLSLNEIIEDCISLGTIPFSMLARHGFIASSIIDSLVRLNIFDNNDISAFHASTETVATKLVMDMDLLNGTEKEREEFFKSYGHLRPGTYDILSPRYSELSVKEFTLPAETIRSQKNRLSFLIQDKKKRLIICLKRKDVLNFLLID